MFVLGVRESGEQTQNVYENKGQVQEVDESKSARSDGDRTCRAAGRKAEADPSTSGLLSFSSAKSTEQTQNVYENKGT